MKGTLRHVETGIMDRLNKMADRANNASTFLSQTALPTYKNAQFDRWKTQGSSEGTKWKELSPKYKAYKLRRYGGGISYKKGKGESVGVAGHGTWVPKGVWPSYLGKGTVDLIATSALVGSLIGRGENPFGSALLGTNKNRTLITKKSLGVYTSIDYYDDVNDKRDISHFSRKFWDKLQGAWSEFFKTGKINRGLR